MTINRRIFLQGSCGAVVAVAASQFAISTFFGDPGSARILVQEIVKKRFPGFDFSGDGLNRFAAALVGKDRNAAGTSGISLSMVLDKNVNTVTFERYVVREFLLNTNYFSHKSASFKGLQYVPFEQQSLQQVG